MTDGEERAEGRCWAQRPRKWLCGQRGQGTPPDGQGEGERERGGRKREVLWDSFDESARKTYSHDQ